jgi:urease accessory protein
MSTTAAARAGGAGPVGSIVTVTPHLDLAFMHHPVVGTHLSRRMARYPFVLTGAFRIDEQPADMVTTILQSASGAILGADRLLQKILVGAGASGHVTSQAALAVHRMDEEITAEDHITVSVEAGGFLEYLPAPRVLFPGSALNQSMAIDIAEDGTAVIGDSFIVYDPDHRGASFRHYKSAVVIRRPSGQLLAADHFDLRRLPSGYGKSFRVIAYGTLLILIKESPGGFAALGHSIETAAEGTGRMAAASLLPRHAGLSIRIAAEDGQALREAMTAAWAMTRLHLTGKPPNRRRI